MTWLRRTIIILLAGVLVALALLPLGHTGWADRIRDRAGRQAEARARREAAAPPPRPIVRRPPRILQSFARITVFSGVPGCVTLGVLAITRRRSRKSAR